MSGTVDKRQHAVKIHRPKQTPAGQAINDLTAHVFRLHALLTTAGDGLAEPSGQSVARWRVLSVIDEQPATVPHIARSWWLTRQSVQRIADLLVADGLAAYEDNTDHLRSKLLRITPAGLDVLADIRKAQAAWADEVGSRLDPDELHQANDVLGRAIDAVVDRQEGPAVG